MKDKKNIIRLLCLLVASLTASYAFGQNTVTGLITDANGEALLGVTVHEKGTNSGTISDIDGLYAIDVPADATLVFSFVGMNTQEIPVAGKSKIDVILESSTVGLEEVVVTALGIEKKSRSLTYSAQQLDSEALSRSKDANMINALAGKSAGVVINKSASGVGGSAKITIRGNRSASGNNQPLFVIDGVPMLNSLGAQPVTSIGGTNDAGARDGGDGIGNLNPDDIESMTILKGASAAALYGSNAANGVVVITTKKGKIGKPVINISSNLTFDNAIETPDFQNAYGASKEGGKSWGEKTSESYDNAKAFFKTGYTAINSASVSVGNEKFQSYYSYANTAAGGIIENNKLKKHNVNIRQTAKLYDGKLQLDGNVNLIKQKVENRPTPGGYYMNSLVGLYRFPRGEDIGAYKNTYEKYDAGRNFNVQNWHKLPDSWEQNPWWLTNKLPSEDVRNRLIASITAKWNINDYLNLQVRGNSDNTFDQYDQNMYATTSPELIGGVYNNGRYITSHRHEAMAYGDVLLNLNKEVATDLNLVASLGASITDNQVRYSLIDSRPDGLEIANVFNLGNIIGSGYIVEEDLKTQMQSLFATAQLGWKDGLFLDLTARNDWSSTLAYTKSMHKGFFYPSAGLTAVLSEFIDMPDFWDFFKVRASYASVGNALPFGVSYQTHTVGAGGSLIFNGNAPLGNLEPELSNSKEAGFEMRFLSNLLTFDFTWYQTNTLNQFFTIPAPAGSGYTNYYVNSGDIRNRGLEIVLGINPINTPDWTWQNNINYAHNRNKVLELHPDLKHFNFGTQTTNSYWMRMEEGGEFGDIYGKTYQRDAAGKIELDEAGLPIKSAAFEKIANANPDFSLSWNSDIRYKNFSLGFLIDGRFGGDVVSITQADLDQYGVTAVTAEDRNRGYVMLEGTKIDDVEGFYTNVGGRDGVSEHYVYSATNIRLRELSLSYQLPTKLMKKTNFIDNATLSFVGRNLFFFYNEAPFDPDATLSTGNDLQGVDVFGMPTTRSLGFNVKLTF